MLNWSAVAYLCSAAAVGTGAIGIVQSYHLREARAEIVALRLRATPTRTAALDDSANKLRASTESLTAERSARAALERKAEALARALATSEEAQRAGEQRASDSEAAARHERARREAAEQALAEAQDAAARRDAELAQIKAEVGRLTAELTSSRTAPRLTCPESERRPSCSGATAISPPSPDMDTQPAKAAKPRASGKPAARTAGRTTTPSAPSWDGTSLFGD